jgi:hypothetical protein
MPGYRLSAAERRRGFDNICAAFCHLGEPTAGGEADGVNADLGILVALARSGAPVVTSGDQRGAARRSRAASATGSPCSGSGW